MGFLRKLKHNVYDGWGPFKCVCVCVCVCVTVCATVYRALVGDHKTMLLLSSAVVSLSKKLTHLLNGDLSGGLVK